MPLLTRLFLLALLSTLISQQATAAGSETAQRPARRLNIILCMADDLGWGDVGFNGNRRIRTPHLDAMAAAGMKFSRFYAAAPVCSPTRASCLTGRHPYRQGIFSANVGHMRTEEWTLAELLGRHGYTTGHFGKWHLGTLTLAEKDSNRGGTPGGAAHYSPPWENGFDTCFSTEAKVPTWDPMIRPRGNRNNRWWDPVADPSDGFAYPTAYWTAGHRVEDNLSGDDSRVIMDRVIPFVQDAVENDRPFLAVVWFHAPHLPVVAGNENTRPYAEFDKYTRHYYGCITALDEQIGRLRRELRRLEIARDTMFWFCADNGPEGAAGSAPGTSGLLRGRKRDLWEGGIRVPGLLVWPANVEAGSVTDVPATTSDYLPTIIDALRVELPDARPLDGESLMPVIAGNAKNRAAPIAFESAGQLALIGNRYKLIRVGGRRNRGRTGGPDRPEEQVTRQFKLFDIVEDPGESKDISQMHPRRIAEMTAVLDAWRASCQNSRDGKDYRMSGGRAK